MSALSGRSHRPRLAEAGLLVVILLLGVVITAAADTIELRGERVNAFLRADNLLANVATPMAWMAIMALGATIVIISGGIDISVGSMFGLSALGTAAVLQELPADAAWYVSVMQQGYDYAIVDGAPDQYVIQSWVGAPTRAVPETAEFTFTRSARDFIRTFVTKNPIAPIVLTPPSEQ